MGYDRWMLSPISRREASQDNERAGGGEGELRNHMVGRGVPVCARQVLKKAPE